MGQEREDVKRIVVPAVQKNSDKITSNNEISVYCEELNH